MCKVKSMLPDNLIPVIPKKVIIGFDFLNIFQMLVSENLEGEIQKYVYKSLVLFNVNDKLVTEFIANIPIQFKEWNVIENPRIIINIDIGIHKSLFADIMNIIDSLKVLLRASVLWSITESNSELYSIDMILPIKN